LLDLRGNIPTFIRISGGKLHDVNVLDILIPEPGAFYVMAGATCATDYPQPLRRSKYHDANTDKTFNFLTNSFAFPAQTVADLYRYRWQVELFFKWINQHLRMKSFFGTSENAVKAQIWIAVSVHVLVAIVKKR